PAPRGRDESSVSSRGEPRARLFHGWPTVGAHSPRSTAKRAAYVIQCCISSYLLLRSLRMAVERTLSIIKPDAVAKNVIGEIYTRFERAGLKIVAAKMSWLARGDAEGFYAVH